METEGAFFSSDDGVARAGSFREMRVVELWSLGMLVGIHGTALYLRRR